MTSHKPFATGDTFERNFSTGNCSVAAAGGRTTTLVDAMAHPLAAAAVPLFDGLQNGVAPLILEGPSTEPAPEGLLMEVISEF